jgi:3-oxoacyl-[acyl-carrier-protein] synthase-3
VLVSERRSVIEGVGSYLPARILSNDDLSRIVDTSDEWIVERTGIRERRIAAEDETTGSLAVNAATAALSNAGKTAADLDLILLATSTPDNTFPATAAKVQAQLGVTRGAAFDLQAVCSGFIYGLTVADSLIKAEQSQCALVIGSETFSRILDWQDRSTCVLFGDGAGAVVVSAANGLAAVNARGIVASRLRSDGRYYDKLHVDGGPSATTTVGHLRMEGREVFKHAVVNIAAIMSETMEEAGVSAGDIDWFVPHQANRRILEGTVKKLGIREDRVVMTLDHHGNTSAASIPLALAEAVNDGRIRRGDLILMEAMGGGFTWGAVLVRW